MRFRRNLILKRPSEQKVFPRGFLIPSQPKQQYLTIILAVQGTRNPSQPFMSMPFIPMPYSLYTLYIYFFCVGASAKGLFQEKFGGEAPPPSSPPVIPPTPPRPHQHDQHPERMPSSLAPSAPPIPSRGIEPHRNPNTRLLFEDQPTPNKCFSKS